MTVTINEGIRDKNEVQCYTDNDHSADRNFVVSAGTLTIMARRQQDHCAGLNNQSKSSTSTSGRINGKDQREYLYRGIQARLRIHH